MNHAVFKVEDKKVAIRLVLYLRHLIGRPRTNETSQFPYHNPRPARNRGTTVGACGQAYPRKRPSANIVHEMQLTTRQVQSLVTRKSNVNLSVPFSRMTVLVALQKQWFRQRMLRFCISWLFIPTYGYT